jgi:hypothetical protein
MVPECFISLFVCQTTAPSLSGNDPSGGEVFKTDCQITRLIEAVPATPNSASQAKLPPTQCVMQTINIIVGWRLHNDAKADI